MGVTRVRTQTETNLTHFLAQSLLWFLAFAVVGCAAVTCRPETVIVAKKDEMARLDSGPGPTRTTGTGRVAEEVRSTLVREYWVQTDQGAWHRVPPEKFRAAEVGSPIEICP